MAHQVTAGSCRLPLETMSIWSSGNGRWSSRAISYGASIQVVVSSEVVSSTGIALGWIAPTVSFGSQVRKP
jgi:hypothetical protein